MDTIKGIQYFQNTSNHGYRHGIGFKLEMRSGEFVRHAVEIGPIKDFTVASFTACLRSLADGLDATEKKLADETDT